jgi:hypothetical protein
MTGENRPLDLSALSAADKDKLILGLWADLRDEKEKSQALEQRLAELGGGDANMPTDKDTLLEQLRHRGTRKRSGAANKGVKVRLGRGLGLLRSRFVTGIVIVIVLAFGLDFGIGWYQQRQIAQQRLAELRLQQAAFTNLLVELKNIAYEPDGKSYRLSLSLQNLIPEQPIYVMLSPIRVFEQSGYVWQEVPAQAPKGQSATVIKLTDRYSFQTIFEPNLKDWTSVMPGYMHIRFDNNMLISLRSEPEDDIVERDDPSYVYLKPYGADDEAIRQQLKFTGTPPVYIPMPPH